MQETIFADGIYFERPSAKAPEFVLGKISIDRAKFMDWLNKQKGEYVNLDCLVAKSGKPYIKVNTYKQEDRRAATKVEKPVSTEPPIEYPEEEINPDDIPF